MNPNAVRKTRIVCDMAQGRRSAGDETRQLVEMADDVADSARAAQHPVAVAKDELRRFLGMALFFLDHEERVFVSVAKNGESCRAGQMIDCVIAPFAGGDAGTVGCQDLAQFRSGEIELAAKFFRNRNT